MCSPLCVHTCVCMRDEQAEKQKGVANVCHPTTISNSQYPAFSPRGGVIYNISETPACKGCQFLVSKGSKDGSLDTPSLAVVPRFSLPPPIPTEILVLLAWYRAKKSAF